MDFLQPIEQLIEFIVTESDDNRSPVDLNLCLHIRPEKMDREGVSILLETDEVKTLIEYLKNYVEYANVNTRAHQEEDVAVIDYGSLLEVWTDNAAQILLQKMPGISKVTLDESERNRYFVYLDPRFNRAVTISKIREALE